MTRKHRWAEKTGYPKIQLTGLGGCCGSHLCIPGQTCHMIRISRINQSINQFVLLRINYIHTSHQKAVIYNGCTYNKFLQCCLKGDVNRLSLRTILCRITLRDSATLFINMYACFLIKILHVGKSRVANMRLALRSLGRKVIFLKTLLYATHNFRNDSER